VNCCRQPFTGWYIVRDKFQALIDFANANALHIEKSVRYAQ
jgi:hypothetical protein